MGPKGPMSFIWIQAWITSACLAYRILLAQHLGTFIVYICNVSLMPSYPLVQENYVGNTCKSQLSDPLTLAPNPGIHLMLPHNPLIDRMKGLKPLHDVYAWVKRLYQVFARVTCLRWIGAHIIYEYHICIQDTYVGHVSIWIGPSDVPGYLTWISDPSPWW